LLSSTMGVVRPGNLTVDFVVIDGALHWCYTFYLGFGRRDFICDCERDLRRQ
jgi:hypothetical protein